MHKSIVASLLLVNCLAFGAELNNEKFQIVAQNLDSKDNVVTAFGSVVIFSPTYYISADKIIYNKELETFELFNNVIIIKDNNLQTQSDYAFINLKDDSFKQTPLFLYEKENKLWVNTNKGNKEKNIIDLEKSIISSCDCLDPDWSIKFSSGEYNTEEKWVDTYNTRLYLGGVPVFYTPYFGFSTDKTRRSGLLIPTVGYSNNEGVYYSQPIYYAPAANYDIEFVPQIRTSRGEGLYTYFRYADSPYSMLKFQVGGFQENEDYQIDNDLENQKHYGWNINYIRTKLFSTNNHQDGLYSSINYMNDIEYKTLENDDEVSVDKKVESRINYFYNTPMYYTGAYLRYYIDTQAENNDKTLQELPQLQFHKYIDELAFDGLIYSADTKFYNYTRQKGLTANVYEMTLPISYTKYFFDDFLYVTLENKTLLSKYNYGNEDTANDTYDNGKLIQNETSLNVGTDLIRPYEDYLHTINLNAKYTVPDKITQEGDLYDITNDSDELKVFPVVEGNKNVKLSLNQSLYNKDNLNQFINHKLSQSILFDENDNGELQNLENYIKVNYDYGFVSNKTIYNEQDKEFIEHDFDFFIGYDKYSLNAGYYQSKATDNPTNLREDLESYYYRLNYKISRDYKLSYYENYNLLEKIRNKQGVKLNINDLCWNLDLRLENEIVPSTTSSNDDSIDQTIVYMNLELKPIGGVKQKYKLNENK